MIRIFLLANAIMFAGFGFYVFLNLVPFLETFGFLELSASGRFESRSNYGAINVGIGLFCFVARLRPALQRHALYFLFVFTGSYATGRAISLMIDGMPSLNLIGYWSYEAFTMILSGFLLCEKRHGATQR